MKFGKISIYNKERISQVTKIFKQKLYLEIAGHVSEMNKSKKKKIRPLNIFYMAKTVVRNIGRTTYRLGLTLAYTRL